MVSIQPDLQQSHSKTWRGIVGLLTCDDPLQDFFKSFIYNWVLWDREVLQHSQALDLQYTSCFSLSSPQQGMVMEVSTVKNDYATHQSMTHN